MRYKFSGTFRDGSGNIVSGGTVSVYASGTTTAASIYETETGTAIVNSTTTGTDGTFAFYILEGDYYGDHTRKIVLSKDGYTSKTYDYVDPTEFVNGPFTQANIIDSLTAIGTSNKATLLLRPGTWVISSNADWSAYTNVRFKMPSGAVLSHEAFTLALPNNPEAGDYQIFSGTGAISGLKVVNVKQFGAKGDGATDDLAAFNYATSALQKGRSFYVPGVDIVNAKYYKLSNVWTIASKNSPHIYGNGIASMLVISNAAGANCITFNGTIQYLIENLAIQGIAGSGHGIEVLGSSHRGKIADVYVGWVDGDGIKVTSGISTRLERVTIDQNDSYQPLVLAGGR